LNAARPARVESHHDYWEQFMSKLRMTKRKKVSTFTPVYDLHSNTLLGYLGDLTVKGSLLVSETPIEVDQTLSLAIEFRTASETPHPPMNLSAHVAWCKPAERRTHYNAGLEFVKITDQDQKFIESVIERHQSHSFR
jgi:hypothetical protein